MKKINKPKTPSTKITEKKLLWDDIRDCAEQLSAEDNTIINSMTDEDIKALCNEVTIKYHQGTDSPMTPMDWVIAIVLYRGALDLRPDWTPLEIDKLRWLIFVYYWQRSLTISKITQSMKMEKVDEESNAIQGYMDEITKLAKEIKSASTNMVNFERELLPDQRIVKDGQPSLKQTFDSLLTYTTTLVQSAMGLGTISKTVVERASGKAVKVDANAMQSLGRTLERLEVTIDNLETELSLKHIAEQRSVKTEMLQLFAKVEAFQQHNPKYYTWHCAECEWEGPLAIQVKDEDKLANSLHPAFTWRCPKCRAILADSKKHPFYWKDLPWSERAWDIACGKDPKLGRLTVLGLAYLLETSWEWIPTVVGRHLGQVLPEHIRQEINEIENNIIKVEDDSEVQEPLPDSSEVDE